MTTNVEFDITQDPNTLANFREMSANDLHASRLKLKIIEEDIRERKQYNERLNKIIAIDVLTLVVQTVIGAALVAVLLLK